MAHAQKALQAPLPTVSPAFQIPVLGIRQIKNLPGRCIFVPMPDDAFAPAINCGDFVVVDTWRRDHTQGSLVWLNYSTSMSFALLCPPPAWATGDVLGLKFGGQTVRYLDGRTERWGTGDIIPKSHLATVIAGHVVGVLGKADTAFNWGAL